MKLNLLKNRSWRRWATLAAVCLLLVMAFAMSTGQAEASNHLWNAWYWNNVHMNGDPVLNTMDPIDFDLGLDSRHPEVDADDWAARFTKTITVDNAGDYTFAARVDDGVRVWVDGNLIIDNWVAQALHDVAATTSLSAGEHQVRVEYFDTRDNAVLMFDWGPQGTVHFGAQPAAPAQPATPGPAMPTGDIGSDFMGAGPLATVGQDFRLNVRRGPSVDYPVITTLDGGTQVEMLYRWLEGFWIAVQLPDGQIGWVNATYLNADFPTGDLPAWSGDPEAALTGAAPAQPSAPAAGEGSGFMGTGPLAFVGTGLRLNVRTGPSVDYPVVETLAGGTEVEMLYRWNDGRWVAVELPNGEVGWVNATYLHADFATGDLPAYSGDPEALAAAPGAPAAETTDNALGNGPRALVGQDFRLNLREGPDVTYAVITTLPGNQEVEMIYRWQTGRWVAVRLPDGNVGWVNATYLNADYATGDLPEWTVDPVLVLEE